MGLKSKYLLLSSYNIPIFIQMKKSGRATDQALLRTAVNKKLQTFSHKRLVRDLQ